MNAQKMVLAAFTFVYAAVGASAQEPRVVPLWPNGAPGFETKKNDPENVKKKGNVETSVTHVNNPSLTVYLPSGQTATPAIVICPGGGHSNLAIEHEGHNVGKWLADNGIAGFVLKYRLAREKGSPYTIEEHAFQDAERALRLVRAQSKEWNVNPARIGIMGFSAGGELAALASTRYDAGSPSSEDLVERASSKPDFQALLYPAVPHDPRLTAETPRAFLACGGNDRPDISQGLAELYLALSRLHVSTELHIYAGVGHGFGIRKTNPLPVSDWPSLLLEWMKAQDLLKH